MISGGYTAGATKVGVAKVLLVAMLPDGPARTVSFLEIASPATAEAAYVETIGPE